MTLASRNATLRVGLRVLTIYTGITLSAAAFILLRDDSWRAAELLGIHRWAFIGAATTALAGLGVALGFTRIFRRSSSVTVFFAVLYLMLAALDISKVWLALNPRVVTLSWQLLASRVVHFGHLLGTFALFASSLYALGARFQRHEALLVLGTVVAAALTWALPIDTGLLQANLTFRAGLRTSVALSVSALVGLSVVNYLYAGLSERDSRRTISSVAVVGAAIGREALFFAVSPIGILVAGTAMVGGALLYAFRNYRDYMIEG